MVRSRENILWTIKVDKTFDNTVQKILNLLGYKSKAELIREAIREFVIRRKLYSLLGGEPAVLASPKMPPHEALDQLHELLKDLPEEVIDKEMRTARDEVSKELLGDDS